MTVLGVLIRRIAGFVLICLFGFGLPVAWVFVSAFVLGLLSGWFGWQVSEDITAVFGAVFFLLGVAGMLLIDKRYCVVQRVWAACIGPSGNSGGSH